ncbi:hypothetical protein GXW83_28200 [Streptacidiphilus sp. PB12-B1b]|uniref:hypothetical protein n=1 Tax=Streptacidiphilus sp. PB12-B1b TaxID=2705012 RepID=UPI0015FA4B80|nr:hypothetical protein [Streptacidiphilus sp. PB12-B1b]QMU79012.1 hypothetical protein GXW83_28200 [Streptacidiphilus sp. PB12-B1b]
MYFAAGAISDLIEWFNANANSEKILCLFVPKDPEDEKLLSDLFNARGVISPQLREIAFCLFSSRATMDELRARTPDWSDYLFVPGLINVHNMPAQWRNWRRVNPARAEMIPAYVRDEVLLRSQAISGEIVEYFQLDDTEPPFLVFVIRDDLTPFVIQTKGSASLAAIRELFNDLDRVASMINRFSMLKIPALIAERQGIMVRRARMEADLQIHHASAARGLMAAAAASSSYGLDQVIRGIDPSAAHHLFRYLGLHHKDKRPLPVLPATRTAAAAAILDPPVHAAFREVVKAGKIRRKVEIEIEELDSRVVRIDRKLSRNSLLGDLRTVEDEIDAVCAKYERKFKRASHYMTLRRFITLLTGAATAVESVTTSIGSTVDNIANGLPRTLD